MWRSLCPEPSNGRQRAVLATTGMFALIVASAMFFSLSALTRTGAEFDCGPAAFALIAGPGHESAQVADCRRAASQRLTTVSGLVVLAIVGARMGWRLFDTPPPRDDLVDEPPDRLPRARARSPRPSRQRRPYADRVG